MLYALQLWYKRMFLLLECEEKFSSKSVIRPENYDATRECFCWFLQPFISYKQVNGVWNTKKQYLKELRNEVIRLKENFHSFEISHVRRVCDGSIVSIILHTLWLHFLIFNIRSFVDICCNSDILQTASLLKALNTFFISFN